MTAEHDARRNNDGSIDMDFYKTRGRRLRSAARRAFAQQLCRAVLSGLKSIALRRRPVADLPDVAVVHGR